MSLFTMRPAGAALLLSAALLVWPAAATALDARRILELRADSLFDEPQDTASLSVVTWQQGELQPVVFQLDPLGDADMVWFPDGELGRDRPEGEFSGADRLLLRLADAGQRAPADASLPQGRVLAEVSIQREDDSRGYFYLAQDDARRHPGRYVHHDLRSGTTVTDSYQLIVDPENELNWQYLGYQGYQGEGSIIDTLKMRMAAGFLNRHARVTLDNTNLRPTVTGHRTGPLRSVMHLETRVVIAGISVMKLHVQAYRYPDHYEAHTYAKVPGLYRRTLRAPEVAVTIDGNAQYGATVQAARGGELSGLVDGLLDDEERELIQRGLSSDESWVLFDSGRDFILLAELDVPPNLAGIPLALVYQDDLHLELTPEQFPGQLPNLGYALQGWPEEQEMRFAVRLLFDNGLQGMAPHAYAEARTRAPAMTVTAWPAPAAATSALPVEAASTPPATAPGSTRTTD